MAISDRNRRKSIKAAQKLLPEAQITGYAIGRSGANPTVVVAAMVGTVAVTAGLLLALTGTFLLPGIIPMLIVQHVLSPPRGVVVAGQGIAVTHRSVWTGRPAKLVSTMAHGFVQPTERSLGRVKVMVGAEPVWMTTGEEAVLRQAASQHPPATQIPNPYR